MDGLKRRAIDARLARALCGLTLAALSAAPPAARAETGGYASVGSLSVYSAEGPRAALRDANYWWRTLQMLTAVSDVPMPAAERPQSLWMLDVAQWRRLREARDLARTQINGSTPAMLTIPMGNGTAIAFNLRALDSMTPLQFGTLFLIRGELRARGPTPDWYGLGVGALLEGIRFPRAGLAVIGQGSSYARFTAQMGQWLPMSQLFALDYPAAQRDGVHMAYAGQSWYLIHYTVLGRPELKAPLERFARARGRGKPLDAAWSEAFPDVTLEAFDAALRAYRQSILTGAAFEVQPFEGGADNPRVLGADEFEARFARLLEAAAQTRSD
jgi:hypothetical protein